MTTLGKRLSRLEGAPRPELPPIAVVSAKLPAEVTDEWGVGLLEHLGWAGRELAVVVTEGAPSLLLEPTPYAWLTGGAGDVLDRAISRFPYATVISNEQSSLTSLTRSEGDLVRQIAELEKELGE